MKEIVQHFIHSLELPTVEFNASFDQLKFADLVHSLSFHLLNGLRGQTSKKFSLLIFQILCKISETSSLDEYFTFDDLLSLSVIGHFHYKNSFTSILKSNFAKKKKRIEEGMKIFRIQVAKNQKQSNVGVEFQLIKMHFLQFVFPELTDLIVNCLMEIFITADLHSYVAKYTIINIMELSPFKEILKNHPRNVNFVEVKNSFLENPQNKSIEKLRSLFPEYSQEHIEKTFAKFNFVEEDCIYGLSNQDLLKTPNETEQKQKEPLSNKYIEDWDKIKQVTLNSLYESSDDEFQEIESQTALYLDKSQDILYNYALKMPFVFKKDSRKSKERQALIQKSKLSHEQLEGWYSMLMRNPHAESLLKNFELFIEFF